MEHHANIVPWQMLCRETGAILRVAPVDDSGTLDRDAFVALLSGCTRIVALAHVSNALGTVNPVGELTRLAHACGALVVIGGSPAFMPTTSRRCSTRRASPCGPGIIARSRSCGVSVSPQRCARRSVSTTDATTSIA